MIDKLELGSIDIMTPLGGGALQLPNGLWEPGSLSAHKGHFGVGATAIPFTAALVAGPATNDAVNGIAVAPAPK